MNDNKNTPQPVIMVSGNLDSLPLAIAYVPMQMWEQIYDPETGLRHGTLFPSLVKPFRGRTVASK